MRGARVAPPPPPAPAPAPAAPAAASTDEHDQEDWGADFDNSGGAQLALPAQQAAHSAGLDDDDLMAGFDNMSDDDDDGDADTAAATTTAGGGGTVHNNNTTAAPTVTAAASDDFMAGFDGMSDDDDDEAEGVDKAAGDDGDLIAALVHGVEDQIDAEAARNATEDVGEESWEGAELEGFSAADLASRAAVPVAATPTAVGSGSRAAPGYTTFSLADMRAMQAAGVTRTTAPTGTGSTGAAAGASAAAPAPFGGVADVDDLDWGDDDDDDDDDDDAAAGGAANNGTTEGGGTGTAPIANGNGASGVARSGSNAAVSAGLIISAVPASGGGTGAADQGRDLSEFQEDDDDWGDMDLSSNGNYCCFPWRVVDVCYVCVCVSPQAHSFFALHSCTCFGIGRPGCGTPLSCVPRLGHLLTVRVCGA